ncbi:MAG: hypothetical protein KAT68_14050 [Bacteroidales bacterium]|nr:hypothetical protein [Bacteroidales bacterium]
MNIKKYKTSEFNMLIYSIITVLITILASSCSSTKFAHLTEIPVEINKKGTYKTAFSINNSTYIIPYIIINDNNGKNRAWGEPIKDTLLHISLKIINSHGEIVFSQEFNNKNIRESNLYMPNTSLSFDMDFKKRIKKYNGKFEAILEIIKPTKYYGKYPEKFVIEPPEKFE